MQKELKIGLAIGAVLLVVLIVYLAVPKNEGDVAQNTGGGAETGLTEEQTPGPSEPVAERRTDTPVADAPKGTDPFGETTESPKPEGATASGDGNWAKWLETGELPVTTTPPLRATPRRDGGNAATPPTADVAVVDPGGDAVSPPTDGTGPVVDTSRGGSTPPTPNTTVDESAAKPETAAGGVRTHRMELGETFSSIAKTVYGDERYYLAIEKANPTLNPTRVRAGTVINLPDASEVKGASSSSSSSSSETAAEKPVDSETEYRVQSGDSLYKIALKRYGTPNMVDAIYELNKQTIGSDSARLKLGMVLKMPPKPAADSGASR